MSNPIEGAAATPATPPAGPATKAAPRNPAKTTATTAAGGSGDTLDKTRRRIVWSCVIGYLGANFLMFLRFFFPRTLFKPKPSSRSVIPAILAWAWIPSSKSNTASGWSRQPAGCL